MHNGCFVNQECPDTFFMNGFHRLVECSLIGRKETIPDGGPARSIDYFKRPVGYLKLIDCDAYLDAVFPNGTRQSRMDKLWIVHAVLRTPANHDRPTSAALFRKGMIRPDRGNRHVT